MRELRDGVLSNGEDQCTVAVAKHLAKLYSCIQAVLYLMLKHTDACKPYRSEGAFVEFQSANAHSTA
jgi:hypothetical protein